MNFTVEFDAAELEKLERALIAKGQTERYMGIGKKSIRAIYTRGKRQLYQNGAVPASGGTPYISTELVQSLQYSGEETGYVKDYAPHVELGHRVVRNKVEVGYCEGQFFFKKNVDYERPLFYAALKEELAK